MFKKNAEAKTPEIIEDRCEGIPKEVLDEVEMLLEEKFKDTPKGLGFCHIYWNYKKNMLADRGYQWESPEELNPGTIFD